ncbi:hypothetical protein SBRY_40699 [Actinacidiphila bryophytorum]|uniref:Uncharacterized protein n=1 Tax=Actinacidiphila bryophytorum TaxID=1436133 RepID=A0A9W4MHF2_9ACTN|nr:hypothetical protein SBRY_40699 [Actinacidiphila bryophytorum]
MDLAHGASVAPAAPLAPRGGTVAPPLPAVRRRHRLDPAGRIRARRRRPGGGVRRGARRAAGGEGAAGRARRPGGAGRVPPGRGVLDRLRAHPRRVRRRRPQLARRARHRLAGGGRRPAVDIGGPAGGLPGHRGPADLRGRRGRPGLHQAGLRQLGGRHHGPGDPVELRRRLRGRDLARRALVDQRPPHHRRYRRRRGHRARPAGHRPLGADDLAQAVQPQPAGPQRLRGVRHPARPPGGRHRVDRLGAARPQGARAVRRRRRDRAAGVGLDADHGRLGRRRGRGPVAYDRRHRRLAAGDRAGHGPGVAGRPGQAARPGRGAEQPAHPRGAVPPLLVVQAGLRAAAGPAGGPGPPGVAGVRRGQPPGRHLAQRQPRGRPDVPLRAFRARRHGPAGGRGRQRARGEDHPDADPRQPRRQGTRGGVLGGRGCRADEPQLSDLPGGFRLGLDARGTRPGVRDLEPRQAALHR